MTSSERVWFDDKFQPRLMYYIKMMTPIFRQDRAEDKRARRRDLMAQVEARTFGPYWVDELTHITEAQWAQAAGIAGIDWGFEP